MSARVRHPCEGPHLLTLSAAEGAATVPSVLCRHLPCKRYSKRYGIYLALFLPVRKGCQCSPAVRKLVSGLVDDYLFKERSIGEDARCLSLVHCIGKSVLS